MTLWFLGVGILVAAVLLSTGRFRRPDAEGKLLRKYHSRDPRDCVQAMEQMGQSGDAKWVPYLVDKLTDDRGIGEMFPSVHIQASLSLMEIGQPALPELQHALESPDPWLRRSGAETIGAIGGAQAVAILGEAVHDADPDFRSAVVFSLSYIRDASAIPVLRDVVADEGELEHIRLEAMRTMCTVGGGDEGCRQLRSLSDVLPPALKREAEELLAETR